MKRLVASIVAALLISAVGITSAHAQRGMGDSEGVARQAGNVAVKKKELSGVVLKVETGPCEQTTGRANTGTHVLIKRKQDKEANIHLGPKAAVQHIASRLSAGQTLTVKAYRTEKMPKTHFVAQSLTFDDETIELRDDSLRPTWVGKAAQRGGRGRGQAGRGSGRGRNVKNGPGTDRGPGRCGQAQGGQGRGGCQRGGPGNGRGGQGRGPGNGPGQGRGPGNGSGQGRGFADRT